eukprot:363411-Chlamydomonas_euryale.AAC.10
MALAADRRQGAAALRGAGSNCCQTSTPVLQSRSIGGSSGWPAGAYLGAPWCPWVLHLEPDLRMELECLQQRSLPPVAGRRAASGHPSAGGQGYSGTGSASWVLGLGRSSGLLSIRLLMIRPTCV